MSGVSVPQCENTVALRELSFLGICLGAQIIFEASDEGPCRCLGILPGRAASFPRDLAWNGERLKIPHMGWNAIRIFRQTPALEGIVEGTQFYFVHSYYPVPADPGITATTTDYGASRNRAMGIFLQESVLARQN